MEQNQTSHTQGESNRRYTVEQLRKLKARVENSLVFQKRHIEMLKNSSIAYNSLDEKNLSPWYTVKEGSYYLGNVYPVMESYMEYNPDKIYDKNMESVIDTMVALGFDPSHISSGFTDEAYGGEAECFVSKGKGTMYYKLLHSEYKEDIRFFVKMVERDIDIPMQKFLQSIKEQLSS
ncbi:hypothetical protein KPH14_010409 [Odynerus spinipes]|uniref:Uncharacterized protein n=1 Tax=Odynerus spinipes TaxID=1348599 RepID=A0AAD9RUA0_9HYME|nr:hypothetical protein KPH14_010409 [Odynerus spinipes]